MVPADPVDLKQLVIDGRLYRPPDDGQRIEAYIPSMGRENHAANLAALPDGDLLCVWFAGTAEGTGDVRIALSRLPHGEAAWTRPVWVSTDRTRSEQNPILFPTPGGALWLLHTAQQTRGCTREEWQARVASGQAEGSYGMQWTSEIRRRISHDGGHTWGPTETLFDRPGAFCRQPVAALHAVRVGAQPRLGVIGAGGVEVAEPAQVHRAGEKRPGDPPGLVLVSIVFHSPVGAGRRPA
ncbi:MAG: exo-alpha-sialidase, partial [Anaerolineae bacterium]